MTSPIEIGTAGLSNATRAVEDAFYVSVGAGVLAVQSAQVRRRELRNRWSDQLEDAQQVLDRLRTGADDGLRIVAHQVDEVLAVVENSLPDGPRDLLNQSRAAGAGARETVHEVLRPTPDASVPD